MFFSPGCPKASIKTQLPPSTTLRHAIKVCLILCCPVSFLSPPRCAHQDRVPDRPLPPAMWSRWGARNRPQGLRGMPFPFFPPLSVQAVNSENQSTDFFLFEKHVSWSCDSPLPPPPLRAIPRAPSTVIATSRFVSDAAAHTVPSAHRPVSKLPGIFPIPANGSGILFDQIQSIIPRR